MTLAASRLAGDRLARPQLYIGPGGGQFVGAASGISSDLTPSITLPVGTAEGDVAYFAGATRNSEPDVDGPDGGGWTELHRVDTSSNEFHVVYWRVLGASPTSVGLDISANSGSAGLAAVVGVVRGVSGVFSFRRTLGSSPQAIAPADAHEYGFVFATYLHSFTTTSLATAGLTFDATATHGADIKAAIGHQVTPYARVVEDDGALSARYWETDEAISNFNFSGGYSVTFI